VVEFGLIEDAERISLYLDLTSNQHTNLGAEFRETDSTGVMVFVTEVEMATVDSITIIATIKEIKDMTIVTTEEIFVPKESYEGKDEN
jgi:hypothetical protein